MRLVIPTVIALAAFALLRAVPGPEAIPLEEGAVEQVLWAGYWTVERGFTSTLEMKNNRIAEHLTLHISLYFPSGEEYPLEPVQLGPREPVVINLNRVIEMLPRAIAARAGKEGSLEVKFWARNASALMGGVSVINPERGIAWNFFMYPANAAAPVAPVRGLFWFHDADTDGFIVVHNASEEAMQVSPRFEIAGVSHALAPFSLRGGHFRKLALRRELGALGMDDATAGGIEFTYDGAPDALKAHGVLFNNRGFSAEIDFIRAGTWDEERTFGLRTPRFAVGAADPRLGLPRRTSFEPVVVLHNFRRYAMQVDLLVGYKTAGGQQHLTIPVTLPRGDTQVILLHPYLASVLPEGTHWASLEVNYTSKYSGIAGAMVSVSQNGEHSIRSVLNWVEANSREGWHWRADRHVNSLLGIYNADDEAAQVRVSLDYYSDGLRHSYELPELTLPPRGSELVDIGAIIAAGVPDADGDIIPANVTIGGYRVWKADENCDATIVTEALILDRRTKSFLTLYNTACCEGMLFMFPTSITDFVGAAVQLEIAAFTCSGGVTDYTGTAFKSSSNISVALVSSDGVVSLVGAGDASITARVTHWVEDPFGGGCLRKTETRTTEVSSRPRLDSLTPHRGLIGASTMVTMLGAGFKEGVTINAGSGITTTVNMVNETEIVATFEIAANASAGNRAVTVTVSGKTSNSINFFVQVPTAVTLVGTVTEGQATCPSGTAGWSRTVTLQLVDQAQPPNPILVTGITMADQITIGTPNDLGISGAQVGSFATNSQGQWPDTYFVCSPACPASTGQTNATQTWTASGISLPTAVSVVYKCSSITVNGN